MTIYMQNSHHSKVRWFFLTFSWYQSHTWISIPRSSIASDSSSDPSSTLLPFNTMIHMVTIKLSSSTIFYGRVNFFPFLRVKVYWVIWMAPLCRHLSDAKQQTLGVESN